jgi:hypothetical protein
MNSILRASFSFASLAWLLISMPTGCQASFDANISSYINVQIPSQFHIHNVSGGMEHTRAHFGAHWDFWKQEGHMALLTHYAQGPLCELPDKNVTQTFTDPPFFLMADSGACSAVTKARHAQWLGASGLILISNHCLCSENCTFETEEHCDDHLPISADDGSGASVVIPTMMIGKGNATHLKKAMRNKEAVLMEMAWHAPQMEHSVAVDLWYTPTHASTEEFLSNFSTLALALALKDQLDFSPHHYILDGKKLQCLEQADRPGSPCYNMCTNRGRYCAVNHKGVHGKDVVTESLRRMCVFKHHAKQGFWEYVSHFSTLCQSSDFFANQDCIKDVFKHTKLVKQEEVEECMKDSGDIEMDDTNTLLAEAMQASEHITETPTVWINHLPLKYPMFGTRSVFESFCMGFATGKAPHVCYACGYCGDPVACAARSPMHCNAGDGEIPEPSKSSTKNKKKGGHFWKFMMVVFILTGAGGFVYYKKVMEDGPGLSGYSLSDALMSDDA